MDGGLVPFYVFTAIMSQIEHSTGSYGWDTLIGTPQAADKIIHAAFIASTVMGVFHLISLVIDVYLAFIFRKISKMPPDMNPLEDNLTARPHKRKKMDIAEKHMSQNTATTADFSNRQSFAHDRLIIPTRNVPFMHTRNDSIGSLALHRPEGHDSDRTSYYSANSHRFSHVDLANQQQQRQPEYEHEHEQHANPPMRQSSIQREEKFHVSPPEVFNRQLAPEQTPMQRGREPSGVSSLGKDNWFAYDESPPSPPLHNSYAQDVSPIPSRTSSPESLYRDHVGNGVEQPTDAYDTVDRSGTVIRHSGMYDSLADYDEPQNNYYDMVKMHNQYIPEQDLGDRQGNTLQVENTNQRTRSPRHPLAMNPPTPVEFQESSSREQNGNVEPAALYSIDNAPIERGYSVSDYGSPEKNVEDAGAEPIYEEFAHLRGNNDTDAEIVAASRNTGNSTSRARWKHQNGKMSAYKSLRMDEDSESDYGDGDEPPDNRDQKGRVVSNSGIDLGLGLAGGSPGYSNYIANLGIGRRRDVSGKMAEEGRGGTRENVESRDSSKTRKIGEIRAAGWARFKGL